MTIVRRILPVLLAAVLLSACGETKDVLPEIEQDVKQEVETVLEEVEPTPEPTQTPEEAKTMASTASNATKDLRRSPTLPPGTTPAKPSWRRWKSSMPPTA